MLRSLKAGLLENFLWQEPTRSPPARDPPPPQTGDQGEDEAFDFGGAAINKRRSFEKVSGSRERDCKQSQDGSGKR
jgi:hypothetical protein